MEHFISMHTFQDEVVDCRRFQIEIHFNRATHHQLKQLALLCILETQELLGNAFFLDWAFQNRRVKESTLLLKLEKATMMFDFDFCGNVRTSTINNRKALNQYNQELFYKLNTSGYMAGFSVDYWETYHTLFYQISDLEELHQNLLKLFRIENRYFKQIWYGEDVEGHFFSCPYDRQKDLFWGCFDFRIALPCLGSNVIAFSNKAVSFLKKAAEIVSDTSGRIAISPTRPPSSSSSYMDYFGGRIRFCPPSCEPYMDEKEWAHSYFLKGVEWFNLLSPLQTSKLGAQPHTGNISVVPTSNGGSIVTTAKDILQTQVSDLCNMKRYLYPVIYPGGFQIPIKALLDIHNTSYIAKPRWQWEMLPVLAEEITVGADKIVIAYQENLCEE